MKLLYAQINPHFLYNTLDIIVWQALRIKSKEIADIADSLAKFLRLNLNNGQDFISIGDELEEVRRYMHIINYRYRDSIRIVFAVAEGLESRIIIKMILQPLIENAILHGIMPKEDRQGTIWIKACCEGDYILFEVVDDGVGCTDPQAILNHESNGYGLKNVHQRIQAYYGPDCGLSIASQPGAGFQVTIRLRSEF